MATHLQELGVHEDGHVLTSNSSPRSTFSGQSFGLMSFVRIFSKALCASLCGGIIGLYTG